MLTVMYIYLCKIFVLLKFKNAYELQDSNRSILKFNNSE